MKIIIPRGKYILAVSGGVDSMVLLDLLSKKPSVELVVANFNHGIRADAGEDEKLVRETVKKLGLPLEIGHGKLGTPTSEDKARTARYKFLYSVQKKHKADAIITAHHQDDVVETAIINILRGTGRRGLTAIGSNEAILRPLMSYKKTDILKYAGEYGVKWREDTTNQDNTYLRNHIRNIIIPKLSSQQKKQILKNIDKVAKLEELLDPLIANLSRYIQIESKINRGRFTNLPVNLGNELIVYWLRQFNVADLDKKTVYRINVALRTAKPNTTCSVRKELTVNIGQETAEFVPTYE